MSTFPDWFPEGCPPPYAADAEGVVYRIVRGGPLSDDDFRSYQELGIPLATSPCRRCGVSLFDSLDGAWHRLRLSPRLGSTVARGFLDAAAGKMHLTSEQTRHVEWWAHEGVIRRHYFEVPVP